MESNNSHLQEVQTNHVSQTSSLHQVTPLSKYLAMMLFILLPFLGGYVGYTFAPEKVVEVERVVHVSADSATLTKSATVEMNNVDLVGQEIIRQRLNYWTLIFKSDFELSLKEPALAGGVEKLSFTIPDDWIASARQSGRNGLDMGVRFFDPKYPGVEDTDTPTAHVEFREENNADTCSDTVTFEDEAERRISQELSEPGLTVYDSDWNPGWADLPSRVLCYEVSGVQHPILLYLYPISEDNLKTLENMVLSAKSAS